MRLKANKTEFGLRNEIMKVIKDSFESIDPFNDMFPVRTQINIFIYEIKKIGEVKNSELDGVMNKFKRSKRFRIKK